MHSQKKYHYFYKITNTQTGEYYYGIHSTNNINDNYMGSGVRINRLYKIFGKKQFTKEIIKYFNTRDEALNYEKEFVNENVLSDILCLNMIEGGVGSYTDSSTKGLVTVRDSKGNCFDVSIDDPRYLSGELTFINQGIVTVRDENGNCFRTFVTDPLYQSGKLTIVSKGNKGFKGYTNIYKDGEYKVIRKIELDEYIKDGWEIKNKHRGRTSPTKDKVWIYKEEQRKCVNKSSVDSYVKNGWVIGRNISPVKNLIGISKDGVNKYINPTELDIYLNKGWTKKMSSRNRDMVTVYDPSIPNGKNFSVSKYDPKYLSGELKLSAFRKYHTGQPGPCSGLKYIHKNDKIKRVKPELLEQYLKDGWIIGIK